MAWDSPLLQSLGKMVRVEWEDVVNKILALRGGEWHLSLHSVWRGILVTPWRSHTALHQIKLNVNER